MSGTVARWRRGDLGDRAEVVHALAARNAILYLAQNIEQGIVTPLTYVYRDAILCRTGGGRSDGSRGYGVKFDPSTPAPAKAGGSGSGFRPTGVFEGATSLPRGAPRADCNRNLH